MASDKPISGKSGSAYKGTAKVCDLGQWTADLKVDLTKYASNCTGGFKRTIQGNHDWSGSIEVWVTPNSKLQFQPGGEYTVRLELDDGNSIEGPIVVGNVPVSVSVKDGTPVSVTYNFEGDGAYTLSGVFVSGDPECCVEDEDGGDEL